MGGVDYCLEVYSSIEGIGKELLQVSEDEMQELLEKEFDLDFYPLETDPSHGLERNSGNEYMKAGFGISSLIAEEHIEFDEIFFRERSQDFREFYTDLGDYGSGHESKHLIQYVNLYTAVADRQDIELEASSSSIILQNLEDKRETVLEMFKTFEKEISS